MESAHGQWEKEIGTFEHAAVERTQIEPKHPLLYKPRSLYYLLPGQYDLIYSYRIRLFAFLLTS